MGCGITITTRQSHHPSESPTIMKRFQSLLPVAAAVVCMVAATSSRAQLVEDLDLRQEGQNAVLVVRFVTPVQYQRSVAARASDLAQVYYSVLPTAESLNVVTAERRLPAGGNLPEITVTDESAYEAVQVNLSRKLVVRFGQATKHRVRAGRDPRSVEIVLEGQGASVGAVQQSLAQARSVAARPQTAEPVAATTNAEVEGQAAALLTQAQTAFDGGNYAAAIEGLNKLLALPANGSSRQAQELIGLARFNAGDKTRAASEFQLFLKLYPTGADADRVRQLAASIPTTAQGSDTRAVKAAEVTTSTTGSFSAFYYGGKSDTRTQEFKDSVLGGLPVLQSDTLLSGTDQRQWQTNVDLSWRQRDAEKDMRFVFRDNFTEDNIKQQGKNKLTALYFDYRSLLNGTSVRVGRQSPTGGGVLYRFDGVQAGYVFAPKWKVNAVVGAPSDALLDAQRHFYGVSVDAEALTKELSGSAFIVQQVIDGEVDRRAVGTDLRYLNGGLSASAQFDYDIMMKAVNVAAMQATWQVSDTTVINAMVDRRTTPVLTLGNVLFFQDPALSAPARRISDLLGTTPVDTLRDQATALTAYQRQARIGGTTALSQHWQVGGDLSVTNVDEIKPVAVLLPSGQPSTGDLWSVGAQLIGTNLYSVRDTHVFNLTLMGGPAYHGTLLSYNNLSSLGEFWQLEPSLKLYRQTDSSGGSNDVTTLALRATYRLRQHLSLESELTLEHSNSTTAPVNGGTSSTTNASRTGYYLGIRYEF